MVLPDGMFGHLSFWEPSSHNDNYVNDQSGLNVELRRLQVGRPRQLKVKGDKIYASLSHMSGMFRGRRTHAQRLSNSRISPLRVCAEWNFAMAHQRCPLIGRPRLLKLQEVPVVTYLNIAFFLTNLHTTLHGSQTGLYFMTEPMSLEEYLGK
jgi:hypothetical protein